MSSQRERMLRGELYHAFVPDLIAEREKCQQAYHRFNTLAATLPRLERINLWQDIVQKPHFAEDTPSEVLDEMAWVEPPFYADYGAHIVFGDNVYINGNCRVLDTCMVTIKSRTLLGPNVSLFSGTHPLDPTLRNGTKGPEMGGSITIEEDCWLGGNVVVLPGVTIGRGSTIGAGAVVTKDIPPYSVAAGNPARILRTLKPEEVPPAKEQQRTNKKRTLPELLKRVETLEAELAAMKVEIKEHMESQAGS